MKIGLLCNVWDDPYGVERILESETIHSFDKLIFVDGKYSNYNQKQEYIDDAVKNIIYKYNDKNLIHYCKVNGLNQIKKRNLMFELAYDLDFGLICDADEIPNIDRDLFESESITIKGCSCVLLDNYGMIQPRPRLFEMIEKPYISKNHSIIQSSKDNRDMAEEAMVKNKIIKSISLIHSKKFYSKYRSKCRNEYRNSNI